MTVTTTPTPVGAVSHPSTGGNRLALSCDARDAVVDVYIGGSTVTSTTGERLTAGSGTFRVSSDGPGQLADQVYYAMVASGTATLVLNQVFEG